MQWSGGTYFNYCFAEFPSLYLRCIVIQNTWAACALENLHPSEFQKIVPENEVEHTQHGSLR